MRESRLRWQSLVDSAPVAIYETDAQGNYIYANQRWLEHAGLSIEQATGASWAQALHPDDRGPINSSWYAAVREGREWNLEYRFCTPERKITWVQGTAIALRDVLGQVTGFLGSNVDITARKLAESEIEVAPGVRIITWLLQNLRARFCKPKIGPKSAFKPSSTASALIAFVMIANNLNLWRPGSFLMLISWTLSVQQV